MVVVDPRALPAGERDRLLRMVAEPAPLEVLASSPRVAHVMALLAGAAACALLTTRGLHWPSPTPHVAPLSALSGGLVALAWMWMRRRRELARTPWRCGVFVHPFGVVVAEPRWVRFVPGAELHDTGFVRTWPGIGVRLRAGSWTTVVRTTHEQWAEVIALMEALPRARRTFTEGYRDGKELLSSTGPAPRSPTFARRVSLALAFAAAAGALVGACFVAPEIAFRVATEPYQEQPVERLREYDSLYGRPWHGERTSDRYDAIAGSVRARIALRAEEPFRTELLELVSGDFSAPSPAFSVGSMDLCRPNAFAHAIVGRYGNSVPLPSEVSEPWSFSRYERALGGLTRTSGSLMADPRGVLTISCRFTEDRGAYHRDLRALIHTRIGLELVVNGRPAVSHEYVIDDDRDRWPTYEAWAAATRNELDVIVSRAIGMYPHSEP